MPIRIYDIAKKLGIESKEVLAKARELGIAGAKVPTSSLDRVTAEYLEEHFRPPATPPQQSANQNFSEQETPIQAESPPTRTYTAPSLDDAGIQSHIHDDSFTIRLERNAEVEIYTFEEDAFRHVGNFAFAVGPGLLAEGHNLASDSEQIVLLTNTEAATLEFKASARWDVYQNRQNPDLASGVLKTIAAFLNTEGGNLLIGVADNGRVLGLKEDFSTLQKPRTDDYILFLNNLVFNSLGADLSPCIQFSVVRIKEKDVCRISVRRSPRPVYVKDGQRELFYLRTANSSVPLRTSATVEYCKVRWPPNERSDARWS